MGTEICDYGKPVAFARDHALVFANFSLLFTGHESKEYPGGPTASIQADHFTVRAPDGVEQQLRVVFGQRPPQPLTFAVQGRRFTLYTFLLPDGTRLPGGHLAVFLG